MTPRAGVKTTPATERAFRGSRPQAGAPLSCPADPILTRENCLSSDLAIHRDARLRQHVLDLRFAQSGGVIFK